MKDIFPSTLYKANVGHTYCALQSEQQPQLQPCTQKGNNSMLNDFNDYCKTKTKGICIQSQPGVVKLSPSFS